MNISSSGLATTTNTSGGVVVITATSGGVTATAVLTVVYGFVGPDPGMAGQGVPANSGTLFTTTKNDASRAPQLIYPNDHVLFPPNVTGIEIHFMPGSTSNTLYEVSFKGPVSTITTYIRCLSPQGINGCIYLPDATLWRGVAISNAGQGEVALTVRGTDDSGSSVGNSATFHMTFSKSPIEGALYYWTTSGKTAIMRWDFGGSTTTATSYLTPTNTGGTCVGCHALSPDGTKVVASAGGQSDGRLLLWDIVNNRRCSRSRWRRRASSSPGTPTARQFVGVYGDATKKGPSNLMIFDGDDGGGGLRRSISVGCAPITPTGRRAGGEHHRLHVGRPGRQHHRSAAGHRWHRLRPEQRRHLGGAADAGPLRAGEEPLLPGHRPRRKPAGLRRVDLHQRNADRGPAG